MSGKMFRPGWFREIRGSEWYITLSVSVGLVTETYIYGMIVPIVPTTLVQRAGVDPKDVQKWISALLASFGLTLMIGSRYMCDRLRSYKLPFLLGLVAISATTLLFMVGTSPVVLVLARALQGFASAVLCVVGLAFMADSVDESRIGRAMGYVSFSLTCGLVSGPVLGGIIFESAGYYAVFAIPIGMIAVDAFLRLTCIEKSDSCQGRPNFANDGDDESGRQPLLSPHRSEGHGEASLPQTQAANANREASDFSAVSDANGNHGMQLDVVIAWQPLKNPRLMTAVCLLFLNTMIFTSFESTLTLYVQRQYHWTPSKAGALFLTLVVSGFFASQFGRLTDRAGPKIPAMIGIMSAGVALLSFRFLIQETNETNAMNHSDASVASSQPYILTVLLVLIGFGDMAIQVVGMSETSRAIVSRGPTTADDDMSQRPRQSSGMGQAYALSNIGFAGGQFAGPVFGGFFGQRVGFPTMNAIMGAIVLCSLIPTALFIGRDLPHKRPNQSVQ